MDHTGQPVKALRGNRTLPPELPKRRSFPVAIDARALRSRRRAAFLSQAEVAEQAGISPAYLCELEKGLYKPSIARLRALARVLGCDIADLMADEQEPAA